MKIAVIGANGKTGRAFVNEAVARGYDVRAGVYRTNTFTKSDFIKVVTCDATKLEDVERLVQGCDVVVSLIGHVKGSPEFLQTTAIANTMSAMKRHRIDRIISLTGTGVRVAGDRPSLLDYVLTMIVRLVDPARIRDGKAHIEVLRESDLAWTVLRVLKLTDVGTHRYSLSPHGPARAFVPRAVVADAICRLIDEPAYIAELPVVSYTK